MLASSDPIRNAREVPLDISQPVSLHITDETVLSESTQQGCKRKRRDYNEDLFEGNSFIIQGTTQNNLSQRIALNPVLVTSRACLPLSYLDLSGNVTGVPGTQLFNGRIQALERILGESSTGQTILIAKTRTEKASLYAIERVEEDLYTLCTLGEWVSVKALEQLQAKSVNVSPRKRRCYQPITLQDSEWWRGLEIKDRYTQTTFQEIERQSTRDIRLSLKKQRVRDKRQLSECIIQDPDPVILEDLTHEETQELPVQTSEDIFSMLRDQYQETLYLMKTSLAYFAKGPLSRARASLQGQAIPSAVTAELTAFLRSCIMSTATMDKKYKEAIPPIINTLLVQTITEDESPAVVAELGKKLGKAKKQKIGKDGLYPGEEVNIFRWWLKGDYSLLSGDSQNSNEDLKGVLLLELRARETQMQIIMLLEALALEASTPASAIGPLTQDSGLETQEQSQKIRRKAKKPQDLIVLLDLFVDRLCIWQSMRMDDAKPNDTGGGKSNTGNDHSGIDADTLKTFCVDVVMPFYGARLPEITRALRQKLGGPKTPSPLRPPLVKAVSSSQLGSKQSSAVQRPAARRPKRTLERVLTDEKTASQRRAPGLSRSNTDSALPGLKRHANDTSLTSISLNRVALHKRYSQREVDLNAASKAAEAKARKKASVEQELQGAIATLKKPNPRMAVKELVEAAEKRAAGSQSRKPKNPVRNLFAQCVQVMATPKGNRQKDVFGGLPRLPQPAHNILPELDEIPPSSVQRVPSSVQKSVVPPSRDPQPPLLRRIPSSSIEQTPTRGPSKRTSTLLVPGQSNKADARFVTPSKPRRASNTFDLQATISTNLRPGSPNLPQHRPSLIHQNSAPVSLNVQQTPSQVRETGTSKPASEFIDLTSSPPVAENNTSIYDALGWNYFDELS